MAKPAAGQSAGMEKAELKRVLRFALEEPVQVAFALGGDGKAIVQMDKRKPGRALEKALKDEAPDSKNHRWGTAVVDPDDPKLVKFVVNKAGGGMARKLVVALKGTGFSKVQIVLEDGSAVEMHEEADDTTQDGDTARAAKDGADGGAGPQANRPEPPGVDDTSAGDSPDATEDSPSTGQVDASADDGQPPGQPSAPADPKELARELTALVKQMLDVIRQDPSQKAALAELATDAQASLKRGDLDQAAAGIEILRQALDTGSGATDQDAAASDGADADDPAAADMAGSDASADTPVAGGDAAPSGTDGGGPQWEAGPSFDPKDDTSGDAAGETGPAPAQDAGALTATLTGLVKQLMPLIAADPTQRDALKGILAQAQTSLKSGDLDTAGGHVDTLRAMLDGAGAQANGQAGPASGGPQGTMGQGATDGNGAASPDPAAAMQAASPAIAKARQAWVATRQKVEGDLGKLHGTFASALQGHSMQDELTKTLRSRVDTVLGTLDDALAHTLDGVNGATDPAQRAKLVEDAHALIGRYQAHVASDETIALLDDNPFEPLAIQKTMTATLAALSKAIR